MTDPYNILFTRAGNKQVQQAVQPEQAVKSRNRTTGRFTGSGQTVGSKALSIQSQEALEMKRAIEASQEELPMESNEMVVPEYLVSLSQNAGLRLNTEQKSQGVETAVRFKEKSVNLAKFYYSSSTPKFDYINCDNDNMSLLFRMHLLNTPSDDELPYIINGFNILHDMTSNEDETREFRKWVAMYKEMQNYRVAMRMALQMS